MAQAKIENDGCAVCGKEATKLCGKCKGVSYCGRACQSVDWGSHGPTCQLFLDHTPFCGVCNASQDFENICFQCGFIFCKPCYESDLMKCQCRGCSRLLRKVSTVTPKNIRALEDLVDRETTHPNKRRSVWYCVLGSTFKDHFRNAAKAKHYFDLAGRLGYGRGYVGLGRLYEGNGDWEKAREAYEKGAALDSIPCIHLLGRHHEAGAFDDGNADYQSAKKWYKKGVRLGSGGCCCELGRMYLRGGGEERLLIQRMPLLTSTGVLKKETKSRNLIWESVTTLVQV